MYFIKFQSATVLFKEDAHRNFQLEPDFWWLDVPACWKLGNYPNNNF